MWSRFWRNRSIALQLSTLTQKEVVYLGMLAIDALDKESRQELADKVHQMQVNGEI